MTRVGLISDTHGLLRPEAVAALRGSDRIIHAGDVGDLSILETLAEIAPVTVVLGNCDSAADLPGVAETEVLKIESVLVHVLHDLNLLELDPRVAGFAAVISGHTHDPKIAQRNGVLYVNPGSAGRRRFSLPISVGRLTIKDGMVSAERIELCT